MKVAAVIFLILALVGIFITIGNVSAGNPVGESLPPVIICGVLSPILFWGSKGRTKRNKLQQDVACRKSALGIEIEKKMKHVEGLPLAQDTLCTLALKEESLSIAGAGRTFQIAMDQVIAAQCKSDIEIQREVGSSLGEAVVGGLLFGPVGAIVGSRTKTKKTMVTSYYLIVNYTNQKEETAVLAFEGFLKEDCVAVAEAMTSKALGFHDGSTIQL